MAVIYLRHPVHGTKVAGDEAEARYDEAQGWKRFEWQKVDAQVTIKPEESVNNLTTDTFRLRPRGRGRK